MTLERSVLNLFCSVVAAIVSHIDLNTLDSLARTSFFIHASLIQYRQVLINSTLHCSNEGVPVDHDQVFRYRARASNWEYMQEDGRNYEAKSGDCARDLVEPCRRCSKVICRVSCSSLLLLGRKSNIEDNAETLY